MSTHKFPYDWTLKDAVFTKDKGKVFTCFACGGGSSMGYKLAGFDVIGYNEIDPRMAALYDANHNPRFKYVEGIQTFKNRTDLPQELYNLDILDGSPPCSVFSEAGLRDKAWGQKKKFREGQVEQVLDTLFYDFTDLVAKLKPKVAISENVEGLLLPKSMHYVREIYARLDEAGYTCQHFLLDGSTMGLPQARRRVFFIALRKDLSTNVRQGGDLFEQRPFIDMNFNNAPIPFSNIQNDSAKCKPVTNMVLQVLKEARCGETDLRYAFDRLRGKQSLFGYKLVYPHSIIGAITASGERQIVWGTERYINNEEMLSAFSFPKDYDFQNQQPVYVMGMSVPPIMMAQIASRIYDQWLSKI